MAPTAALPELMPVGAYARALKQVLPRRIFEPDPWRLLWLVPHLAVIVAGIAAIARFDWPWYAQALVSLAIGQSFACLGFLGHEVLHGAVVRSPRWRSLVGQLCLWPFALGPRLWRRWHNVEHHGHTQQPGEDPDAMQTLEDFLTRPSLRLVYRIAPPLRAVLTLLSLCVWFSLHALQMLRRYLPQFSRAQRAVVLLQFVLPAAGWAALWARLGPADGFFAYGLPLLVANFTVMSYIVTNHLLCPLTPVNDPLVNSLSVRVPRWLDALHLNFSHHTEHHIFPAVSGRHAPQVRAWCRRLWPGRYHELPLGRALWLVCTTPRVYEQPTVLIDPVRDWVYPVVGCGLERGRAVPVRRLRRRVPAERAAAG